MSASTFLRRLVLALSLAITLGFSPLRAGENNGETPTVHLVAIGDLDVGGGFGQKVEEDARNIITTLEKAFSNAGRSQQLKTNLVVGGDVTPENVLRLVSELDVRPNDTLVVLYSGHGLTLPDNGHVLTFHHGDLLRERLLKGMKAKNPRLMILLTDCCSNGVNPLTRVTKYQPREMQTGDVVEWNTISSLFLKHSGLVDISAAEPGFSSVIDLQKRGSLFTNALLRVLTTPYSELVRCLDRDGDGQIQWDEVLPQLRGLAAHYHRAQNEILPPHRQVGENRFQQAYATSLGRWMPSLPTAYASR